MARKVDWSLLPLELVQMIAKEIDESVDYYRFCLVCTAWLFASSSITTNHPIRSPWLMHPLGDEGTDDCTFFCLATGKTRKHHLPEARGKNCCGTSCGWIAMIEEDNESITLLNPVTREERHLPPTTEIPSMITYIPYPYNRTMVEKIILCTNPTRGDSIALAIVSETVLRVKGIAYSMTWQDKWYMIDIPRGYYTDCMYHDHDDKFYVIDSQGGLFIIEFNHLCPLPVEVMVPRDEAAAQKQRYIAPIGRDVYMVCRIRNTLNVELHTCGVTMGFEVFMLKKKEEDEDEDEDENEIDEDEDNEEEDDDDDDEWIEVEDIQGMALFVGVNQCFSLDPEEYSEPGLEGNCIYFTDDFCWRLNGHDPTEEACAYNDLGVFSMDDGQIRPLPYPVDLSQRLWPRPKWFTPSLY